MHIQLNLPLLLKPIQPLSIKQKLFKPTLIFALLFFTGYVSNAQLPGVYFPKVSMSPNGLSLAIKPGGTFVMDSWSDILGKATLTGTWLLKNKRLLLTEDSIKTRTLKKDSVIKVVEEFDKNYTTTWIHIIDAADNKPLPGAVIGINNDTELYDTDTSGSAVINNHNPLKYIMVSYIPLKKNDPD